MRTLFVFIVALVVLGGIWFWYRGQEQPIVPTNNNVNINVSPTTTPRTSTSTDTNATTSVRSFTVSGSNYSFTPANLSVKRGETVNITFRNATGTHDLVIDEFDVRTDVLQSGETDMITFVANQVGTFEYYCSVGNHREMGMEGTLTVTP